MGRRAAEDSILFALSTEAATGTRGIGFLIVELIGSMKVGSVRGGPGRRRSP
jgi:hypothetical protein